MPTPLPLGASLEDLEIQLLLEGMSRHWGFDFEGWAQGPLRHRVRRLVSGEELDSISALQARVLHDASWRDRLLLALSDPQTPPFAEPRFWLAFRQHAVPLLRTYPQLRVWVPGCGTGADLWSLAILLQEEGLYDRTHILATDMNDAVLDIAALGCFPASALEDVEVSLQNAGGQGLSPHALIDGDRVVITRALRRNIYFSRHNLVREASPNTFHVILAREVLLRFARDARDRALEGLSWSLVPFGWLALGQRAPLEGSAVEASYRVVDGEARLFQRRC